ncbi:hypothetical protein GCM10007916_22500 [Psychromonas marina]|uniref:DUF3316 domain-containing protein n=1 Tax=Psychromonas marina TaxID=88364 RepID=A0ABQ6E158_9GAMM|nr:DUF3316 domain-containing protein [Psychromonas marina]GLS91181.1 hypothetical protein GCM10007916_22500 [Psychromonas marina]
MKLIKKSLIASAMVILSTQAFAVNQFHHHANETYFQDEVVTTVAADTKAAAYELGLNKLTDLKAATPSQLEKDLGGISMQTAGVYIEDGSYITVAEKMGADGQMLYTGVVHLSITYSE